MCWMHSEAMYITEMSQEVQMQGLASVPTQQQMQDRIIRLHTAERLADLVVHC